MIIFPIIRSSAQISGTLPAKWGVVFLLCFSPLHYLLWSSAIKMYERGSVGWGIFVVCSLASGLHILLFQSLVRRALKKRRKKRKKELKRLAKLNK